MNMSIRASRTDVARLRLQRQGLAGDGFARPVEVVERMLAVQGQDYAAVKWAIGLRAPGTTEADVDAAINSGEIVRSWPMRGTLHFVPAVQLNWMLQLTAPRILAGTRTRQAQLELDQSVIEQARTLVREKLTGGGELSRAEFLELLERKGIATAGQRGYHLIWHLAQSGTLCWGRQVGRSQVLVLLDEWVPTPRRLERDEALGEFVLRYFEGHGPATIRDFVWWSQLTVADATIGLAVAGDRLTELIVDNVSHYLPATAETGEAGSAARQRSPVLALPGFDEYLLGYRDRTFSIDDAGFGRVVPGRNGIFLPLMLSSGRVIGTWRRQSAPRPVTVEPKPFTTLTARQQASFERVIRDYSRFLGTPVTVLPTSRGGTEQR